MTVYTVPEVRDENRDAREGAAAADLLDHPGWVDVLKHIAVEAKAARSVLLGAGVDLTNGTAPSHAKGSLDVLRNIVLAIYRRANKEIPPNVAALFE